MFYLSNLNISFPNASTMMASSISIPIICMTIKNLSPGLRPVTISTIMNSRCPPSSPGIGIRFMTPSMMDSSANRFRNIVQFHTAGKT